MDSNGDRGRSMARGRARGVPVQDLSAPFFQRRGVGPRRGQSVGLAMEVDEQLPVVAQEEIGEDVGEVVAQTGDAASKNGSGNGNGNGSNGKNGSNGTNGKNGSNGSNGSGSNNGGDSADEETTTGTEMDSDSQSRDDAAATTRGNGRGIRPDIIDYVVTRPPELANKQGTSGAPINLVSNYFRLQHKQQWTLRQYRVDVRPEMDETKIRKKLVAQHQEAIGFYIFDGTMLMRTKPLSQEPLLLNSVNGDTNYVVEIRFIREFAAGDPMTSQFYNLIVRKTLQGLNLELLGRHYYDKEASIPMPNWRLDLWPGFITSMRKCEEDVLLNVEVTHKMIRTDNVLAMMQEIRRSTPDMSQMREKVAEMLVGKVVMTRYNSKTYKIDGINWETNASGSFPTQTRDGEEKQITYREYYQNKYGIAIQSAGQPLLVSKPRQKLRNKPDQTVLLIPELCFITGLDEDQRSNFNLMKDMGVHLHMVPDRRVNTLKRFMDRIRSTEAIVTDMTNWGIRYLPELTPVPGRVLPSEELRFGSDRQQGFKADWSIAFRSMQMFSTPSLTDWALVVPQRMDRGVDNLISTMKRVSKPLNYIISDPRVFKIQGDRQQNYIETIDNLLKQHREKVQMMFFVLPNPRIETYAAIKKRVSIDYGVPSQCFLSKNVNSKGLMSIATKVVIQMCAKQGGEPWSVVNPLRNLMVIGFDVYHCAGRKDKSVGAMVASMSQSLARYFSTVSFFSTQDEMAQNMGLDFLKCLTAYKKVNNVLPARIMLYRDGVGEGQLNYVCTSELEQIKAAISHAYGEMEKPKLTYVVVSKRINTRLFLDAQRTYDNPPPGTVVDSVVTLPERYDFFIVAQSVRQGTVSPTSYNTIFDSSGLPADKLQIMSFKLCHLYFNWSGTVAVPAPCQYAHKLAYLTGLALGGRASDRLAYLLHFL